METVSEYIFSRLAEAGVETVFMVSGGGGMFLIDALGRHPSMRHVCNHHEQAAVMAAEGLQRTSGGIGVALVTTGPAGTNAITGVLCAWNDSIPLLVLSGQANSKTLIRDTGLRQRGVHEADIVKMVSPVTKYAVTVTDPATIAYHLDKALYLATHGRPGPVWLDIPIDVQSAVMGGARQTGTGVEAETSTPPVVEQTIDAVSGEMQRAERPVVLLGNGVRLAHAEDLFFQFVERSRIPVVTTKNAFDIISFDHPLLVGYIGTYGQRRANFAVQNADLVIVLGSRLSFPTVGYATSQFARAARKIVVDIDTAQLTHMTIDADMKIHADCRTFLQMMNRRPAVSPACWATWRERCRSWRDRYPLVSERQRAPDGPVNSYYFFEALSEEMTPADALVCDQGAAFYSFTAAFKNQKGQRAFTNGGFSPMGYGIAAAIGACFSKNVDTVVCVHGDGGLQMNLGELQTIAHHALPLKLFVFNNNGYLSIKHTQNTYFDGRLVGADPESGVSCPSAVRLGEAHHMATVVIENNGDVREGIRRAMRRPGPVMVEVMLDPLQPFEPRVTSHKRTDGTMVTDPLEEMFPKLPVDILREEMLIPLAEP